MFRLVCMCFFSLRPQAMCACGQLPYFASVMLETLKPRLPADIVGRCAAEDGDLAGSQVNICKIMAEMLSLSRHSSSCLYCKHLMFIAKTHCADALALCQLEHVLLIFSSMSKLEQLCMLSTLCSNFSLNAQAPPSYSALTSCIASLSHGMT